MTENLHKSKHDYDKEYLNGAHWEHGNKPSSNIPKFLSYLRGNEKILDAGCGSGRDVLYLASQGFKVAGVDQSQIAITKAIKFLPKETDNISYAVGKIEKLPYQQSEFDAVYSGYVLGGETFPQQLSEIARVLKPRGIFYLAMFTRTEYEEPCERDEENPKDWVMKNIKTLFNIVSKDEDSYQEPDDRGIHTHDRLRLVLKNKGKS